MRHFALGARVVMLAGLVSVGCVSPVYEKASIEPGFKLDAGIAAMSYANQLADYQFYGLGLRGDMIARYSKKDRFEFSAQLGFGGGNSIYDSETLLLVDGGLGFKYAFCGKRVKPAIKVVLGGYTSLPAVSTAFLLGIAGKQQMEAVTLGLRTNLVRGIVPFSLDVFGILHTRKRFSVFAGLDLGPLILHEGIGFPPIATIGVGYTIK